MFEDKITTRRALTGNERRRLKRAYQDGDSKPSSRLRVFLLAVLAVVAVMIFMQVMIILGGPAGDRLAAEIFGR